MNDDAREAGRQLLRTPLITASLQPEAHRQIRRHADELVSMFRKYLGYRLAVDARLARLYKAGLGHGERRPMRRGSKAAFSTRDYTYLALICSVLLNTGQQVLLSSLVADVEQAAAEAAIALSQDTRNERLAFVHALRQLIAWGALVEEDGSVDRYSEGKTAEALLTIERDVVRANHSRGRFETWSTRRSSFGSPPMWRRRQFGTGSVAGSSSALSSSSPTCQRPSGCGYGSRSAERPSCLTRTSGCASRSVPKASQRSIQLTS